MPEPFVLTPRGLDRHFQSMQSILADAMEPDARIQLNVESAGAQVVASLRGSRCELVQRNRGPSYFVAPFLDLQSELKAWVGFREEWDIDTRQRRAERFVFRTTGITIHFGRVGEVVKPQMF